MTSLCRWALASLAVCLLAVVSRSGAFAEDLAQLAVPLDGTQNAIAETNLGDLVADAVRSTAGAEIAFIQASALQPVTVPAGQLTADALRGMAVFPDEPIVVLRPEGARIREALERSLSLLPYPNKGFLQISGIRLRFDPARPAGARVQDIIAINSGAPLAPDRVYRVAMPESLARGALGYFRVFNGAPRERTELTLLQALTKAVSTAGSLAPRVERRIQATQPT